MRFTHPDLKDVSINAVLHALADPARRSIVRALHDDMIAKGSGLSCSMAAPPGIPKATMSSHYTILRSAGLVRARNEGVRVVHKLRNDELEHRFPGLLQTILQLDECEAVGDSD